MQFNKQAAKYIPGIPLDGTEVAAMMVIDPAVAHCPNSWSCWNPIVGIENFYQ